MNWLWISIHKQCFLRLHRVTCIAIFATVSNTNQYRYMYFMSYLCVFWSKFKIFSVRTLESQQIVVPVSWTRTQDLWHDIYRVHAQATWHMTCFLKCLSHTVVILLYILVHVIFVLGWYLSTCVCTQISKRNAIYCTFKNDSVNLLFFL